MREIRTLVVAQDFPWPPTLGSHLRLGEVVLGAAELGEVDMFCFVPARRSEPCAAPETAHVTRFATVPRSARTDAISHRLRWALFSRRPLELFAEPAREFRDPFGSWARASYDAVWFSKATTFELLDRPRLGPTVVDLDDLEDRKILGRLDLLRADGGARGSRRAHDGAAAFQARLNAARWERLQRSVASGVERVVLCSDLDASRSGLANCTVIPNGYDDPVVPLGRVEVGDPPSVLFAGSYCYGPNADGAHWLVSSIWPVLRSIRPDALLRLVGEPDSSVPRLADPPSVSVVGTVATMEPELGRADLVVVPLRYGSGTRVKILEAFAHRIPVVSTTLGAEGLGAEDGVHLLLADDPERFARACARALSDGDLRARMVEDAYKLFFESFRWSSARARIRTLLGDLSATGTAGDGATVTRP